MVILENTLFAYVVLCDWQQRDTVVSAVQFN